MIEDKGCFDINECLRSDEVCSGNQFCINKEGSYTCLGIHTLILFIDISYFLNFK